MKIGFAGLGLMGSKMAMRLLKNGYSLYVYNRTYKKTIPLVKAGATAVESPLELAKKVDLFITMLSDEHAVESVLKGEEGAFKVGKKELIFIDMSTVKPDFSIRISKEAEKMGFNYLEAPVLGNPRVAERGELKIIVSGKKQVYKKVKSILEVFGTPKYLGEHGVANKFKLAVNHVLIVMVHGLAESLAFSRSLNIEPKDLIEIFDKHPTGEAIKYYWNRMMPEETETKFYMELAAKDLCYMVDTARTFKQSLPAASTALQTYMRCFKTGIEKKDYTRIIELL